MWGFKVNSTLIVHPNLTFSYNFSDIRSPYHTHISFDINYRSRQLKVKSSQIYFFYNRTLQSFSWSSVKRSLTYPFNWTSEISKKTKNWLMDFYCLNLRKLPIQIEQLTRKNDFFVTCVMSPEERKKNFWKISIKLFSLCQIIGTPFLFGNFI